ncbi:biotin-dependent carboxyltransferase family protein [Celeribacter halophilus]|uniref:Biotin-dependent carboxyltransferase family protein n=1 Tax=Celeribacter halophilus TaxID=576117 RepID=A0AAW7XXS0_9RHOB|nr:biotin-dependent carboxyltransferase family protein [Celeribacter halophilus]MDO6458058.1 biotin-dependent carboxyltransferase family protein [Celeribacter halophilus]MDO6724687.1 biotin-dependent carboxyltransferase family protein [Celeribacter halophilus]
MTELVIHKSGPGLTVQDLGRTGLTHLGLSRGGAADPVALYEAAALLGHRQPLAAIEMAGFGGTFEVTAPTRIALTGAPMRVRLGSKELRWNASHLLEAGERLSIGAAERGTYGYLSFAGGIETPEVMGSRSTHGVAGIGAALATGARLPLGPDQDTGASALGLPLDTRFSGGEVRYIAGPQTALFALETRARFEATTFARSATANRQGVRLEAEARFLAETPEGLASDFILEGDLQMTGDGLPYVLLNECQTIGGYPRIGTVIAADLPLVAQAPLGAALRFRQITLEEADRIAAAQEKRLKDLRRRAKPLIRDPATIHDLLRYQLISGVTAGDDLEG